MKSNDSFRKTLKKQKKKKIIIIITITTKCKNTQHEMTPSL